MCGPHRRFGPLPSRTLRRIPQAIGAVATRPKNTPNAKHRMAFQYRKR